MSFFVKSERVKSRREYLKLSQSDLAKRIHVSRQAVSRWESALESASISESNLYKLAKALSCGALYLSGKANYPNTTEIKTDEKTGEPFEIREWLPQNRLPAIEDHLRRCSYEELEIIEEFLWVFKNIDPTQAELFHRIFLTISDAQISIAKKGTLIINRNDFLNSFFHTDHTMKKIRSELERNCDPLPSELEAIFTSYDTAKNSDYNDVFFALFKQFDTAEKFRDSLQHINNCFLFLVKQLKKIYQDPQLTLYQRDYLEALNSALNNDIAAFFSNTEIHKK